ncbi:helix-turn-helix transcriptional regulator [Levilactobacillus yiduensis]|uniref:helix-turn-helix transcriptional regulator n=1 Tax=Levilactobacillus yiduensis TaxID=2953880 RepID=UPI0021574EB4|nr:AraC family transcriptional regulator [Levilactobacillus yiduensis]
MRTITCIDISEPVLHFSSGKFTAGSHWKHKPMYHDGNFEIIIVVKGTLYLQVDNSYYVIQTGDVFALPPFHHLHGYKESPENTQYFWFHFFTHKNAMRSLHVDGQDDQSLANLFKKDQIVLPLQYQAVSLEKILIIIYQVLDMAKTHYFTSMSVDYLLTALLIEISQDFYSSLSGANASSAEARIDGIKEWIRANLNAELKASTVAENFDLNAHYLVRIFKEQTGQTIIQYINQLKLQQAAELLLQTNFPIKRIASAVFFSDEKRFMKAFKARYYLTPTEFRHTYTKKFLDSSHFDPEVPIVLEPPEQK